VAEEYRVDFSSWSLAEDRNIPAARWYAPIEIGGDWWLVAVAEPPFAEDELHVSARMSLDSISAQGVDRPVWPFVVGPDGMPRWGDQPFASSDEVTHIARENLGIDVGRWQPVPAHVPLSLYETASWVTSRPR
jgi:hypothetical protein